MNFKLRDEEHDNLTFTVKDGKTERSFAIYVGEENEIEEFLPIFLPVISSLTTDDYINDTFKISDIEVTQYTDEKRKNALCHYDIDLEKKNITIYGEETFVYDFSASDMRKENIRLLAYILDCLYSKFESYDSGLLSFCEDIDYLNIVLKYIQILDIDISDEGYNFDYENDVIVFMLKVMERYYPYEINL